ncbi:MAG TPA: cyclic nucleotide-binding domain-containing protein [Albitalea sp.]|nr:cyclic nucleotide-binding domain-containing protein [Albitalea sp.]
MKRIFDRIKRSAGRTTPTTVEDSRYFTSMLQEMPDDAQIARTTWRDRAAQIAAAPADRERGAQLFAQLWGGDRHVVALNADELQRMSHYLEFVQVAADKEVIAQDELGDYMAIVLEGTLSVDRVQPWGGRARLAEAHAGDMLGEMSLLDAGARFSSCVTLSTCMLAVVDVRRLDEMITQEPRLGVALLASLSRRLSLRLRQVSARLSALLSQN